MGIVVREVDEYGSIHDEDLVVSLATMEHNRTNTNHPMSSSTPSWTTKKVLMCAGIMGMTAAVASSAVLFFSILDYFNQDSTASSFLLHARGGADDHNCVVASGPWPTDSVSTKETVHGGYDQSGDYIDGPFVTCFIFQGDVHNACWSHSYYYPDAHDWFQCRPTNFGTQGWSVYPNTCGDVDDDSCVVTIDTCGTGCTELSQSGLTLEMDFYNNHPV